MKGISVEKLVYDQLFPKARPNDPQNFQAFCTRCIIGEVRSETQAFYGHLDTQEAKFPGLDYTNPTHRIRLGRFTWHRRLFRAFDALALTPSEISNLTRWEGTKWAKDKYEKEHNTTIRDTTSDGIATWDDELGVAVPDTRDYSPEIEDDDLPRNRTQIIRVEIQTRSRPSAEEEEQVEEETEQGTSSRTRVQEQPEQEEEEEEEEEEDEDEASEPELQSVGVALNARLREGAARREAGDSNAVLDEEWEQWLKHIVESGLLHDSVPDTAFRQFFETTVVPAGLVPVDIMSAARAGRWSDVPDFLHSLLRRTLEAEQRGEWDDAFSREGANLLPNMQALEASLSADNLTSPRMTETPRA